MSSIDIGALDRRLVLQAPSEIADGAGGVIRDYATVATVWASVTPLSARGDNEAERLGAALRLRVVIRFRDDVTTRHRLIDGARAYRVVAVRESGRRRFLEIDAEQTARLKPGQTSMATPASVALRAAVRAALIADGALTGALGGAKIYDEPPRAAAFPYVTLGEARIADFSTGDAAGQEHTLTLHAWSRQGGHNEAHVIAGALLSALDDAPLTLSSHRLVNLRFAVADVRREADGRTYHALVRFRAVTEPL